MLIFLIVTGLIKIFSLLTQEISLPQVPDEAYNVIGTVGEYISMGFSILSSYTDVAYIMTLFGVLVLLDMGVLTYKFIMWIIRKIPLANIS